MNRLNPSRMTQADVEALARRDRRRILLFTLAALALAVGYFVAQWSGERAEERAAGEEPVLEADVDESPLVTMEFDRPELLEAVNDASPEARLTLAGEALTALLYYSNVLTDRHYRELGARDVDAAVAAEIAADPAAARGEHFRVRGVLETLGKRRRSERLEESYGALRLEDGTVAHVALVKPPAEDGLSEGDFVRLNGMFLQLYNGDVNGSLVDAPLFVGRTLARSYPQAEALDADALRALLLAEVDDDELNNVTGVPTEPLWELMAYAAERADEVDWEAAGELDNEALSGLAHSGPAFRGVPFRIPISVNVGSHTEDAGENRLRLERTTHGWIGNVTWKGIIRWVGPFDAPELIDRYGDPNKLTARGFFLKNTFYEQKNGEPGRAPLFVMASVDPFIPPFDPRPRQIMWGVFIGTLATVALIWFLLRRDKRAAAELQAELVRRRRARRERVGAPPEGVAPESGSPGGP